MRQLAKLRRLLARRPWIYWTIVLAVAAAGAMAAASAVRRVDAARARWGERTAVLVTTRDVAAGAPLAALVEERAYPSAMVPPGALSSVDAAAAAIHPIAAGEVVVALDVAATAEPRSLIPSGWLAVAVSEAVPSGVTVGDRVVVAAEGIRLATDALVVGGHDGVTLVAVPETDAPAVAASNTSGSVALLIRP